MNVIVRERELAATKLAELTIGSQPGGQQRAVAHTALIDTVAVALAAAEEPVVTMTRAGLQRLGGTSPDRCTDWTGGGQTAAGDAAVLNGTAAHALDYDDVWDAVRGHPSAVLMPALMAAAELAEASGADLFDAYAVALDVGAALAAVVDLQAHYVKGWHATSTIGVMAATAGAARLLGSNPRQVAHAIGIAASSAAGTRQNFGSMTKPLHAGLAARSALTAAVLAAEGVTADAEALDGPMGFFHLYGGDVDAGVVDAALTGSDDMGTASLSIKRYPCCYNVHRAVEAAITLHLHEMAPDQIDAVDITVEPTGTAPLLTRPPVDGLEGKFSGEYCVAAALVDGHIDLGSFTDEAVERPVVRSLAGRVGLREADQPPTGPPSWQDGYAVVQIRLVDGTVLEERIDAPTGHGTRPLTGSQLRGKFDECLSWAGLDSVADQLYAALDAVATGTVEGLANALRDAVAERDPAHRGARTEAPPPRRGGRP